MKLKINNNGDKKEYNSNNLKWIDIDCEVPISIFLPSEIAIEVGCNYSTGENECFNIDDIRHDIECYFVDSIENILENTIEYIRSYGDDVQ